jgi:hypothetical protein
MMDHNFLSLASNLSGHINLFQGTYPRALWGLAADDIYATI